MKKLIVFGLLLLTSTVWACDSYESCMDRAKQFKIVSLAPEVAHPEQSIAFSIEAIAYKLDEISKKLDKCKTLNAPMLADPEPGSPEDLRNKKYLLAQKFKGTTNP